MLVTRVARLSGLVPIAEGRFTVLSFAIEASIRGTPDAASGMVVNLATMKDELRRNVVEALDGRVLDGHGGAPKVSGPEDLARAIFGMLGGTLAGRPLARVRLRGTPGPVVEYRGGNDMDVTRIFDFSASHRLHAPALPADENLRVFGKCNNPAGHGHNYILEVTLRGRPGGTGELLAASEFDRIVQAEVVDRWDHRNLNVDLREFHGINPTAEEIARTAWRRLAGPLGTAAEGRAKLHRVKLCETERNHVEYFGEDGESS
jgi:6-pyruvoyltetrahydropterin/6-carboxytetrahydropterin synthase